jgi:hypothetical protein
MDVNVGELIDRAALHAAVRDVRLESSGPFPAYNLSVLRIIAPLTRPEETTPFVVATMYFSARALRDIEDRNARYVWVAVALIGAGVVLALFANVSRTSRLISAQRRLLAKNAADWRRLAGENKRLHLASEQLRLDASSANESLLVRVGSDIHDGPVQVLALLVLKLSDTDIPATELDVRRRGHRAHPERTARGTRLRSRRERLDANGDFALDWVRHGFRPQSRAGSQPKWPRQRRRYWCTSP